MGTADSYKNVHVFLKCFFVAFCRFASFLLRCIFFNDHCEQLNSISRMNAF